MMRMTMRMIVAMAIVGAAMVWTASMACALPPVDACCKQSCADPAWTACQQFVCVGGAEACRSGYSETEVGGKPCGEGDSADCPATEIGQCADGVNNDVWTETGERLTDCQDPDCRDDPVCLRGAPALDAGTASLLAALLGLGGVLALRRRAHR
jgi:hypothetical protein